MRLPRASGILLHPTSLPGPFGIGDLGPEAHRFVAFLAETGQRWWQILPLGPTGYGNSPYQSYSSHAGNPWLISPEGLAAEGWLDPADWRDAPRLPADQVDFDAAGAFKERLLRKAFARFKPKGPAFEAFLGAHAHWLDDYALFMALKEAHGGAPFHEWEPALAARKPAALARPRKALADAIRYRQFTQYAFDRQWQALREACRERGIAFIGDLPIFVAPDSADVWSRPDLFQLDPQGRPAAVAGVPPDYFSQNGQLWGNPLYDWKAHQADGFAWWIDRVKASLHRVDLLRLDHFRGFEAYWRVPAGAPTAATGRWEHAPGAAFLAALRDGLGGLPLIAEDLGDITPEVEALRDRFDLPGMRVLQFAFGTESDGETHMPHRYVPHCVAYTGTHDNDTTVGWFTTSAADTVQSADDRAAERRFARRYLGTDGRAIHWDMIRLAFVSVADTAIVPLQDVLGVDGSGRMNVPGRARGNWGWRFRAEQLDSGCRDRLADMTAAYSRWNGEPPAQYARVRTKAFAATAPTGGNRPQRAGTTSTGNAKGPRKRTNTATKRA